MSSNKVLDRPASSTKQDPNPPPQKTDIDVQQKEKTQALEERQQLIKEVATKAQSRMQSALDKFKASAEIRKEAAAMQADIDGRIRRLGQGNNTNDAFERESDLFVASAISYIVHKAQAENKKAQREKDKKLYEQKKKEQGEGGIEEKSEEEKETQEEDDDDQKMQPEDEKEESKKETTVTDDNDRKTEQRTQPEQPEATVFSSQEKTISQEEQQNKQESTPSKSIPETKNTKSTDEIDTKQSDLTEQAQKQEQSPSLKTETKVQPLSTKQAPTEEKEAVAAQSAKTNPSQQKKNIPPFPEKSSIPQKPTEKPFINVPKGKQKSSGLSQDILSVKQQQRLTNSRVQKTSIPNKQSPIASSKKAQAHIFLQNAIRQTNYTTPSPTGKEINTPLPSTPKILQNKSIQTPTKSIINAFPKAVPLSGFYKKFIPIRQSDSQNDDVIYDYEINDRGVSVTGNMRTDDYTPARVTPQANTTDRGGYSPNESGGNGQPPPGTRGNNDQQQKRDNPQKKKKRRKMPHLNSPATKQLGKTLVKTAFQMAMRSPIFWGIVIIIIIILLLVFVIISIGEQQEKENQQNQTNGPVLTLSKTGPQKAKQGQNLEYTITADYPASADDLTIIDRIPKEVTYISSSPSGTFNDKDKTVTWNAKALNIALGNPATMSVRVVLKSDVDNLSVVNIATATITASSTGNTGGTNVPPSDNDCHGVYKDYMDQLKSINKTNYGDPQCELVKQDPNGNWIIDKDKMLEGFRAIMSKNDADGAFYCVVPKESSYNSNAWNKNSTSAQQRGTTGAFGNFQMNEAKYSNQGQPEDVGDVSWRQQVQNAMLWKKKYNNDSWSGYWPEDYQGCLQSFGAK